MRVYYKCKLGKICKSNKNIIFEYSQYYNKLYIC